MQYFPIYCQACTRENVSLTVSAPVCVVGWQEEGKWGEGGENHTGEDQYYLVVGTGPIDVQGELQDRIRFNAAVVVPVRKKQLSGP